MELFSVREIGPHTAWEVPRVAFDPQVRLR
jgi:hypothetical protein